MKEEGEGHVFLGKVFFFTERERCEETLLLPPCLETVPVGRLQPSCDLRERMVDPLRMRWEGFGFFMMLLSTEPTLESPT